MSVMRRGFGCEHRETVTTITAGLAREVCETCGEISVRYVENSVQVYPNIKMPRIPEDRKVLATRRQKCSLCRQDAVFMIPDALVCDEHAWQAAARLDWGASDPWVPIPLRADRPSV